MKTNNTCYKECKRLKRNCDVSECRYNIDMPDNCNCVLIASDEKHTLQEVGNIYGVTRMRICQIEKRALKKLGEFATYLVQ